MTYSVTYTINLPEAEIEAERDGVIYISALVAELYSAYPGATSIVLVITKENANG